MRERILEQLSPLISDFIIKAKGGRIRDENKARIRIAYANSVANLIRAYNGVLRDMEVEELKAELEELKDEFKEYQKGY